MTIKALLWSKRQNCFHIEPLRQLLAKNLAAFFAEKQLNDYHLIGTGTDEEVRQMAEQMRPILTERDQRTPSPNPQP